MANSLQLRLKLHEQYFDSFKNNSKAFMMTMVDLALITMPLFDIND